MILDWTALCILSAHAPPGPATGWGNTHTFGQGSRHLGDPGPRGAYFCVGVRITLLAAPGSCVRKRPSSISANIFMTSE